LLIIPIKFAAQFNNRADQKNNFADQKNKQITDQKNKICCSNLRQPFQCKSEIF
jgi:hypothetical protein